VKNYKNFSRTVAQAAVRFLCNEITLMLLHRRENTQIALHALSIVIADVVLNHLGESLLDGGFNTPCTADAQYSLVVDADIR
jgi:hypothetical protein